MNAAADKRREEREMGIAFMEKHRQQAAAEALTRLRDEFAGLAMQAVCANPQAWGMPTTEKIALHAYRMADAMLRARGAA